MKGLSKSYRNFKKTINFSQLFVIDTMYYVALIGCFLLADVCSTQLACQNGGYTDPKNCGVCRCPDGYGGTLCDVIATGSPGMCLIWVKNATSRLNLHSTRYFIRCLLLCSGCNPVSQVFNMGQTDATQCVQGPTSYVDGLSCTWDVRVRTRRFCLTFDLPLYAICIKHIKHRSINTRHLVGRTYAR